MKMGFLNLYTNLLIHYLHNKLMDHLKEGAIRKWEKIQ